MTFSIAGTALVWLSFGVLSAIGQQQAVAGGGSFGFDGLLQYGAIGLVCGWLMIRVETRLKDVEHAIDRLTRAQLVLLLSQPDLPEHARETAQQVLREVDGEKRK